MNSKAQQLIDNFTNIVISYIEMEYDLPISIDCVVITNIVIPYYLGGNSVGDTAAYVVNYLRSIKHE